MLYVEQQWCLSLLKSEFFVGVEQQMVFEFVRMMVRNLKIFGRGKSKKEWGDWFFKRGPTIRTLYDCTCHFFKGKS